MTLTNGYATLDELRDRLGFPTSDVADDHILGSIITAVSRWIDAYTGRRFYTTVADETRYQTAEFADLLILDLDVVSLTTLSTDGDGDRTYETTWAATDFDLEPYNATLDGEPYRCIAVTPAGRYGFPRGIQRGVKIVGKFGWTTAPGPVNEACLLQSERIYKRKDAPFGVLGSAEMGQMLVIPKLDPDVELMLRPYRRGPLS